MSIAVSDRALGYWGEREYELFEFVGPRLSVSLFVLCVGSGWEYIPLRSRDQVLPCSLHSCGLLGRRVEGQNHPMNVSDC